jgi:hypothetical protein
MIVIGNETDWDTCKLNAYVTEWTLKANQRTEHGEFNLITFGEIREWEYPRKARVLPCESWITSSSFHDLADYFLLLLVDTQTQERGGKIVHGQGALTAYKDEPTELFMHNTVGDFEKYPVIRMK